MEKWVVTTKKANFQEIAEKFHINQVTARLIRNRDVVGDDAIEEYLNGSLLNLHNPHMLLDCDKAVEILLEKLEEQKKIRIIGDYDIDGVNATVILYKGLRHCHGNVDYEIPHRIRDGYGINIQLIQDAYEDGVDTIITCDNGIAAVDQVEYAKSLGMTVIITDHHEPMEEKPKADAIVNPKQQECTYPYKQLCGAAIAYKVIVCLYEAVGISKRESDMFIEYAAIATIGDVMDLTDENRIIVKEGLQMLSKTTNLGLKALIEANGLKGSDISSYHIGFVLGPSINAGGRLDTAERAVRLLLTESESEALQIAEELKLLNDERKSMTLEGLERAVEEIETGGLRNDKVFIVYLPDCHESLAGIIAGRIRERYHKPTFVLTDGEESVKGSGRSIEAYQMFDEMMKCRELFLKFGGHPMAAGLSILKENVPNLRERLNALTDLTEEDFIPKVTIDIPMPISYISEALIDELAYLEPFGKGNPKPLFAEKNLNILSARILGKNKNVIKLQILNSTGISMDAMYFGDTDVFQEYLIGKFTASEVEKLFQGRKNRITLSLTYYPSVNEFRDVKTIQIVIQHYM